VAAGPTSTSRVPTSTPSTSRSPAVVADAAVARPAVAVEASDVVRYAG
jgi:hypothetical protein